MKLMSHSAVAAAGLSFLCCLGWAGPLLSPTHWWIYHDRCVAWVCAAVASSSAGRPMEGPGVVGSDFSCAMAAVEGCSAAGGVGISALA
jgi:hypothetical protein